MDDVLIEKIKNGNDHAFRLLVEKYRNLIFHTVYGVLRNEKDAEDATQEVFLKIYTSLPKYENQGFKTWMTRIAVNHAIDIKRKKVRRKEDQQVEYEESYHTPSTENVEFLVIQKERRHLLRERLKELPANYREVVEDFYIQEKSYQEIAEKTNVKTKTIEVRLYRARQWMKKHWKEDDFS
ncbi:RNA polymerase sigma factor [Lederbergia ruris]|uniref:RNA polymerase sigma factor SigW n=1 Tax=Lederbergia ruris TaxID=217495 RepID=A0ABQ4KKQ7_9BACI|nr:sigma-70 family RNA polymerase sigma factor [Lederbergia ruris]GIN58462.1 RNA polymerase sigma factor SigW [Lederbergia ruris]